MITAFEQIEAIKDYIIREVDPEQIILFGSYARGDFNEHSDADFLIVLPDDCESNKIDLRNAVYSMKTPPFKGGKDFIIKTAAEVEYWRYARNHIIARAMNEGKTLYAKIH